MSAKVTIIGNITRDPETRQAAGQTVCSFGVGVRTSKRKQDGSYESNFYECSAWGKRGEYVMERAQKGTQVFISGDLCLDEYTAKDGTKRSAMRITTDTVELLNRLKDRLARTEEETLSDTDNAMPF